MVAEIKVRAERRCGELLREMAVNGERPKGRPTKEYHAGILSNLGISNNFSSRCQKIAAIPKPQFEAEISKLRDDGKEITSSAFHRLAASLMKVKKDEPGDDVSIARSLLKRVHKFLAKASGQGRQM